MRTYESLDVEVLSIIQVVLIAYFLIRVLRDPVVGLLVRLRNLIP